MGGIIMNRSISEHAIAKKYLESTQAFWLAEAGVNKALKELRNNFSVGGTGLWPNIMGSGAYAVDVINISSTEKRISAHGYIPNSTSPRITRTLEVSVIRITPPSFFDNAIYSAGSITLNGDTYEVNGNVTYATTINDDDHINPGPPIQNASISPLARLDFSQLYILSQGQGNVYNATRLAAKDPFPGSFWFNESLGIPNIVYVVGDLTLNGNIGTIGGFFVVVGDVINTPDITQDSTINGNGQIDGLIYTRGEFRVNGGGGNLNVNGGVWAGELARLNGNARVDYNATYMAAVEGMNLTGSAKVGTWQDTQTLYQVQ